MDEKKNTLFIGKFLAVFLTLALVITSVMPAAAAEQMKEAQELSESDPVMSEQKASETESEPVVAKQKASETESEPVAAKQKASESGTAIFESEEKILGSAAESVTEESEAELMASVISISSAEELKKIGSDSAYPMTGDYVLTEDIDLSGEDWIPLGGYIGEKGSTNISQANVFSGTFDGQGHVISGLTIHLSGSVNQTDCYGQVGLFSVIASNNSSDYASVKNMIFTDVTIHTNFTDGLAAIGTLAGEVNGYATVDNISVINGTLTINPSATCDTVGAGGVIGECRTSDTGIGNGNITIKNIYNGADINASGSISNLIYAGGIIGRIAKSACKEVSQCVNTGIIQYDGYDAYAICAAEGSNTTYLSTVSNCYYLNTSGQVLASEAVACTQATLTSGTLQSGLPSSVWSAQKGCYPVPAICFSSSAAGQIYLSGLSLNFADGESAKGVSSEIELPQTLGNQTITWSSSDDAVLHIEDGKAIPNTQEIGSDTVVILTAVSQNGYQRTFKITVISDNIIQAVFDQDYAQVGVPLTVSVKNPGDLTFRYSWNVGGKTISNTSNSYTPTSSDLEKFIKVRVTATDNSIYWDLVMYVSELPVVYVNTDDGQPVTSNNVEKGATLKVQGNSEFNNSKNYYDGKTSIKGRGNSTWSQAVAWNVKKPYKLKLSSKANLLGLGSGKNKHWVLLANMIDHTNMRNEIVNNFSKDIGMEYAMNTTDVVLVLNGEYQGLYQLCEHVRVGTSRVNVYDWEELGEDIASAICEKNPALDPDTLETQMTENFDWATTKKVTIGNTTYNISDYYAGEIPDITGGFLLDMDFRSTSDAYKYISTFQTSNGIPMFFRRPEYAKTNTAMLNYAKNYLDAYEAALQSKDFTTTYNNKTVHYTDLFDMDSLVQYWWVCEYTNNWDSMKNSTYLYKDLTGKAKMGPAWDYDWAFGNINMYSMTGPFVYDNWHTTLCGMSTWEGGFAEQTYQYNQWNRFLVKDPYFVTKVYDYYEKYRSTVIEDIMKDGGTIDTLEKKYQTAANADDAKWSSTYGLYSGYAFINGEVQHTNSQTYHAAVASLKTFIKKRMAWMDGKFTDVKTLYQSLGNTVSSKISVNAEVSDSKTILTATVNDANAKYVEFVLNGKALKGTDGTKYVSVSSGKARIEVENNQLETGINVRNTIQVLGINSSKGYITGEMNFTNFKATNESEHPQDPDPTPDPDPDPENLTGVLKITSSGQGTNAQVGDTLTAAVTGSNNSGILKYQWMRNGVDISGASSASYQLKKADVGKKISISVTSTVEKGTLTAQFEYEVIEKTEEDPDNGEDKPSVIKVQKLTLTVPSKTLQVYQTTKVTVKVSPQGASSSVFYKSSNPKAATISSSGKITAKAAGSTTIIVTAKDGSNVRASFVIKVAKPKLTVSGSTKVKKKKSITLTAKAVGLKGKITWKLDAKGKKLLKLNKTSGTKVKLTAKTKTGTATLTVSCDGKKVNRKIKITK